MNKIAKTIVPLAVAGATLFGGGIGVANAATVTHVTPSRVSHQFYNDYGDVFTIDLGGVNLSTGNTVAIVRLLRYLEDQGYDAVRLVRASRFEVYLIDRLVDRYNIDLDVLVGGEFNYDRGRGYWDQRGWDRRDWYRGNWGHGGWGHFRHQRHGGSGGGEDGGPFPGHGGHGGYGGHGNGGHGGHGHGGHGHGNGGHGH